MKTRLFPAMLLMAAMACCWTACSDKEDYEPNPDNDKSDSDYIMTPAQMPTMRQITSLPMCVRLSLTRRQRNPFPGKSTTAESFIPKHPTCAMPVPRRSKMHANGSFP